MHKILLLALLGLGFTAKAAVVTLSVEAASNSVPNSVQVATNDLSIGQYEVAELLSFVGGGYTLLFVVKDGRTVSYGSDTSSSKINERPLVVSGPAILRLASYNSFGNPAMATFRITPEAFPPDRALLVPPGTNQVQITLECSTNLVNWFSATNGVYGPLPEAKFFRIKLDKLQ